MLMFVCLHHRCWYNLSGHCVTFNSSTAQSSTKVDSTLLTMVSMRNKLLKITRWTPRRTKRKFEGLHNIFQTLESVDPGKNLDWVTFYWSYFDCGYWELNCYIDAISFQCKVYLKVAPKINTKIKDIPVTCDKPLTHMRGHTTAALLRYVIVIPC